jgi:hypothetical protein
VPEKRDVDLLDVVGPAAPGAIHREIFLEAFGAKQARGNLLEVRLHAQLLCSLQQWLIRPGKLDGQPVALEVLLVVPRDSE